MDIADGMELGDQARGVPKLDFLHRYRSSYRFNLTGYGLFNLEKSLIIGLGASLVSFTVLFIQISSM